MAGKEVFFVIDVEHLSKNYGDIRAVNDVSFSVPKGQIMGFLGPNGAGKSTTMKMITSFIEPTEGSVRVGGFDVRQDSLEVRKLIGYLPESAPSYGEMLVREFLEFIAEIRGERGVKRKTAAQKMREVCSLSDVWDRPIETLSKGYRQRVGFAQALIHDAPVLILDEPTDGLDPNQKYEVRKLIKEMGQDKTIILSTHILEEVEAVCERVVIIAQGKIVADATPDQLKSQSNLHNAITIRMPEKLTNQAKEMLAGLGSVSHVEFLEGAVDRLRVFPCQGSAIIEEVTRAIKEKNLDFDELHVEPGRLEDVFRKVTRQVGEVQS
jgi:ABC-2 type transport system ATP-binding protein